MNETLRCRQCGGDFDWDKFEEDSLFKGFCSSDCQSVYEAMKELDKKYAGKPQ